MAKKKPTKKQSYPVINYQFGGLNLPFLDQYQSLTNNWNNFWRGGNYFNNEPRPYNYDPTNPTVNDPWGGNMLLQTLSTNQSSADEYKKNKEKLNQGFQGEWGHDALDYYYTNTLNNQYTQDQLTSFQERYRKEYGNPLTTINNILGTGKQDALYNQWKEGRDKFADEAGRQYDSDKSARGIAQMQQPGVNKRLTETMKNSAAGIFTGLNYMNSYVPPEKITLDEGSKGIMYTQMGGDTSQEEDPNLTGYTPGTSTSNKKYNIIKDGSITMKNTPFDILALGLDGADKGLINILKASSEGKQFKANKVFEIPVSQKEKEEANQRAQMIAMEKAAKEASGNKQVAPEEAVNPMQQQMQPQIQEQLPMGQYGFNNPNYLQPLLYALGGGIGGGDPSNRYYNPSPQQQQDFLSAVQMHANYVNSPAFEENVIANAPKNIVKNPEKLKAFIQEARDYELNTPSNKNYKFDTSLSNAAGIRLKDTGESFVSSDYDNQYAKNIGFHEAVGHGGPQSYNQHPIDASRTFLGSTNRDADYDEYVATVRSLRQVAQELGVKNYGENFSEDEFKKLQEKIKTSNNPFYQAMWKQFENFSKKDKDGNLNEDSLRGLNDMVSNSNNTYSQTPMAQTGGSTDFFFNKYPSLKNIENLQKNITDEQLKKEYGKSFNEVFPMVKNEIADRIGSDEFNEVLKKQLNPLEANRYHYDIKNNIGDTKGIHSPAFDMIGGVNALARPDGVTEFYNADRLVTTPATIGQELNEAAIRGKLHPKYDEYISKKIKPSADKYFDSLEIYSRAKVGQDFINSYFPGDKKYNITEEKYNKARKSLENSNDPTSKKYLEYFKDLEDNLQNKQDILDIMNNVAYNNKKNNIQYAQFGGDLQNSLVAALQTAGAYTGNYTPEQQAFLNQLSGGNLNSPESYINATPEFNARMLSRMGISQPSAQQGVNNTQFMGGMQPVAGPNVYQGAANQLSSIPFAPYPDSAEQFSSSEEIFIKNNPNLFSSIINQNTSNSKKEYKLVRGGTQKVAEYQEKLKAAGYDINVDGAWGPKTQAAYEDFTGKKAPSKTAINSGKAKVNSNINKTFDIISEATNSGTPLSNTFPQWQGVDYSSSNPLINNTNYSSRSIPPILQSNINLKTMYQREGVTTNILPNGEVAYKFNKSIENEPTYADSILQYLNDNSNNPNLKSIDVEGLKELIAKKKRFEESKQKLQKNNSSSKDVNKRINELNREIKEKARGINFEIYPQYKTRRISNNKYGGKIKKYQFGGSPNDEHSTPIFSSNLEDFGLTEIQTEKGEVSFLPDGSIPDVKAKELHKNQDKNNVTDIMPSDSYIFSNDPKMKFSEKSKLGNVELKDIYLGKSVFKYKENEVTPGPEKIMLKDMFFNGSKKELTTAEIAKNIKKNLPVVDLKNDYYADRAIAENKEQRVEYLTILKGLNEFKKPKEKGIPKAQYGMPIQPTQNGLDGVMGYGDKQLDPFKRMDNNMLSMFNFKQPSIPSIPKPYENGGDIPHADLGKLLRYASPIALIGSEAGAWYARNKQRKENDRLLNQYTGLQEDLQSSVDRSGALGIGTNIASYAAALNVPLQRYDDQSEQMAMYNAASNRALQRLEASKYTASQGIGTASSLARYSNPTNYGDYLAKVQSQSDSNIGKLNQSIAQLEMDRANKNMELTSLRNAGRNNSLNMRDTQLYNVDVQGITNIGTSLQSANTTSADTRYRLGMEKMAYENYLKDKERAAAQRVRQEWEGVMGAIGQVGLSVATGGIPIPGLTPGSNKPNNVTPSFVLANSLNNAPGVLNPNQMSPADGLFNNTYNPFSWNTNTLAPGATVNRNSQGLFINPLMNSGIYTHGIDVGGYVDPVTGEWVRTR